VSMIVQSEQQLNYLAINKGIDSLGVLLFKQNRVRSTGATLVIDSIALHIHSLHALRVLQCTKCDMPTELSVGGLTKLQFLDLSHCY
jgi:hypothetical protein